MWRAARAPAGSRAGAATHDAHHPHLLCCFLLGFLATLEKIDELISALQTNRNPFEDHRCLIPQLLRELGVVLERRLSARGCLRGELLQTRSITGCEAERRMWVQPARGSWADRAASESEARTSTRPMTLPLFGGGGAAIANDAGLGVLVSSSGRPRAGLGRSAVD